MIKILHIASFLGNIGDNASHIGLYNIFDKLLDDYVVTKIEIRKFYKNYQKDDKQYFNQEFVDLINDFDLCIIGGGGFLDYWIPNSKTGTTIDIDPKLIKDIKTPTLFTSIGCNPHKEIPEGNIEKFRVFLDEAIKNKNIKIAVRNDGSVNSIKRDIGEKYLNFIDEILDHGFFYTIDSPMGRIIDKKYIAINITNDQVLMKSELRSKIDMDIYHQELKATIKYIVNELKLHIVFVPHIYSDLKAISNLLDVIDDDIIRNHITIAPSIQGDHGANYLFSIYKNSEIILATRFHANVCNIAMGKKVIGLIALDRVEYLYQSIGIKNRTVLLDARFSEEIKNILDCSRNINNQGNKDLYIKTIDFYKSVFGEMI